MTLAMMLVLFVLAVVATVVVVCVVRGVRRRRVGRRWLPMREVMLHDARSLPSTYLARIDTRPEAEAGGRVMATDLINGARGPLMLPGVAFDPGSVVCFTWTRKGLQIRNWLSGRLWNACTAQAARGFWWSAPAATLRERASARRVERAVRVGANDAVAAAEQILRDQRRR